MSLIANDWLADVEALTEANARICPDLEIEYEVSESVLLPSEGAKGVESLPELPSRFATTPKDLLAQALALVAASAGLYVAFLK